VTLNMIQMHRDGWIMDGSAAAQWRVVVGPWVDDISDDVTDWELTEFLSEVLLLSFVWCEWSGDLIPSLHTSGHRFKSKPLPSVHAVHDLLSHTHMFGRSVLELSVLLCMVPHLPSVNGIWKTRWKRHPL
jgi:hypothetical protein